MMAPMVTTAAFVADAGVVHRVAAGVWLVSALPSDGPADQFAQICDPNTRLAPNSNKRQIALLVQSINRLAGNLEDVAGLLDRRQLAIGGCIKIELGFALGFHGSLPCCLV